MEFVIPLILIVLLWLLVILPQQRRLKAHRAFVSSLAVGDEVITTAGLFGTITSLGADRATLEIAPGIEVTTARFAIGERQPDAAEATPDESADPEGPAGDDADDPDEPADTEERRPGAASDDAAPSTE